MTATRVLYIYRNGIIPLNTIETNRFNIDINKFVYFIP